MDEKIKKFIKENEVLIQNERWEEIYRKYFPDHFTETLLECGINPLKQGLNYIPNCFLYACNNIKEFTISSNIISIGKSAFQYCHSLIKVEVPSSVTKINNYAFQNCSSLIDIKIPNSVTSIGNYIFSGCNQLIKIDYLGTKKEALTILKVRNKKWRDGSAIKKIICTDGEIIL